MRTQPERRVRMWSSWQATTTGTSVELILRLDDDDLDTLTWAETLVPRPRIVVGPRLKGYASLPRFFNEMASVSKSDLVMCGNDDMIFLTPGWPTKLLAAANYYPDGIFNFGFMTYPAGAFPFSCVSRQVVERLGFLNDERLLYSDIFLRDVMARFGRAILLPEIVIQHIGIASEETNAHKWGLHFNAESYWALHNRVVEEAVKTLWPMVST